MRRDYSAFSDEENCRLAQVDPMAEEHLLIKYKGLVRSEARSLFLAWGDHEDLIQEGMIGLYRAIRGFREDGGAKFVTFARRLVLMQMYNAITKSNRKKNLPMQEYVSLDSPEFISKEEEHANHYGGLRVGNPEQICIAEEEAERLREHLLSRLSKLETDVFSDYVAGMSYEEIGKKLSKDTKSVDNAVQRIRAKMKQVLVEETD